MNKGQAIRWAPAVVVDFHEDANTILRAIDKARIALDMPITPRILRNRLGLPLATVLYSLGMLHHEGWIELIPIGAPDTTPIRLTPKSLIRLGLASPIGGLEG